MANLKAILCLALFVASATARSLHKRDQSSVGSGEGTASVNLSTSGAAAGGPSSVSLYGNSQASLYGDLSVSYPDSASSYGSTSANGWGGAEVGGNSASATFNLDVQSQGSANSTLEGDSGKKRDGTLELSGSGNTDVSAGVVASGAASSSQGETSNLAISGSSYSGASAYANEWFPYVNEDGYVGAYSDGSVAVDGTQSASGSMVLTDEVKPSNAEGSITITDD